MPLFSLFSIGSRRKVAGKSDATDNHDIGIAGGSDASLKAQRRHSRRDFFRSLIAGPRTRPGSVLNRQEGDKPETTPSSPPMQNADKPLPPPPPPRASAVEAPGAQAQAAVKLNRIISPVRMPEVQKVFSGAPHFFVRSEGQHFGAPWPSVAFPWNIEIEIRDLSDHGQIEDQAWGFVTAAQHITRDVDKTTALRRRERQRAHYRPRCFERPNMLSSQGLERGTMGFSAALQLGVADALREDAAEGRASLAERRDRFLRDRKRGIRPLTESAIVARLVNVADLYDEDVLLHKRTTVELYTDLFTQVLHPPTRVTDSDDPYSLHVQIEELLDILGAPNIWIDFSLVEWRIRLGQILWEDASQEDADEYSSDNTEAAYEPSTHRQWLLLQILLSCELLIRLDAITQTAGRDPIVITPEEIQKFDTVATQAVRWSLILARRWLDNVCIEILKTNAPKEQATGNWLAALTRPAQSSASSTPATNQFGFQGKHQARQFSGLVHFARRLDWPKIDIIAGKLPQDLLKNGGFSTPSVGTPLSFTKKSSYFDTPTRRPDLGRGLSRHHRISAMVHPSGWLSRSYLSGLILPGEGLSHFLISTLLENDEAAVAQLGDEANLYGGFVYGNKSFWSTACIVGRVLAAGKGASECMGWLSTDVMPKGLVDGWLDVEVEAAPQDVDNTPETARIWKKRTVEKDSHVLGDGDSTSILPGDFTLPVPDPKDAYKISTKLESLDLFAAEDSEQSEMSVDGYSTPLTDATPKREIKTYSAMMRFTICSEDNDTKELNIALTFDAHFVTAHPCVPSQHNSILESPVSPDFQSVPPNVARGQTTMSTAHDLYLGHPLHKSFTYTRLPFVNILIPRVPGADPLASLHTQSTEIFVIDCSEPTPPLTTSSHQTSQVISTIHVPQKKRFGSDLEMLARAWCAEKGLNALISRKGRNCIACSIREARALGWKIVLRFG